MAGIAFQIPGGRYRRAKFFVCIPPGINRQFLLDGVRTFKQEVSEFCILGRMNMLPTGFFPDSQWKKKRSHKFLHIKVLDS